MCHYVKGLKGDKGDTSRESLAGLDTSGFPAGFVEGPQGPPGSKVGSSTDCHVPTVHELNVDWLIRSNTVPRMHSTQVS